MPMSPNSPVAMMNIETRISIMLKPLWVRATFDFLVAAIGRAAVGIGSRPRHAGGVNAYAARLNGRISSGIENERRRRRADAPVGSINDRVGGRGDGAGL